jgi:hypothetical protein
MSAPRNRYGTPTLFLLSYTVVVVVGRRCPKCAKIQSAPPVSEEDYVFTVEWFATSPLSASSKAPPAFYCVVHQIYGSRGQCSVDQCNTAGCSLVKYVRLGGGVIPRGDLPVGSKGLFPMKRRASVQIARHIICKTDSARNKMQLKRYSRRALSRAERRPHILIPFSQPFRPRTMQCSARLSLALIELQVVMSWRSIMMGH